MITLPTDVVVSSVKNLLSKIRWIDLISSDFLLTSILSHLTYASFESSLLSEFSES